MSLQAYRIQFLCGISYNKGNLTSSNSATGYFEQAGTLTYTGSNITQGNAGTQFLVFPVAFSATPTVVATNWLGDTSGQPGRGLTMSISNITNTQALINWYQTAGATAESGRFGVHWRAIGAY